MALQNKSPQHYIERIFLLTYICNLLFSGSLYFGNMYDDNRLVDNYTEIEHRATYGILHRGRHKHGAMPISDGER